MSDPVSSEDPLRRFQERGDRESLTRLIRARGLDLDRYGAAVTALSPVLDALASGESPLFAKVDRAAAESSAAEVEAVVGWMAGSDRANLRAGAIGLMGALGWPSFLETLESSLASEAPWERLTAVRALARMESGKATELLLQARADPDPEVRAEAARALDPAGGGSP